MSLTSIDAPLVSLVILTYNSENHIRDCLVSSVNQDYSNIEIFVVDNASTDKTLEIVDEITKNDTRVKIIKNSTNLGYCEGNNIGVKQTIGEYILILNPDAVISKDFVSLCTQEMKDRHSVAVLQPRILSNPNHNGVMTGLFMDHFLAVRERNGNELDSDFFYASGCCIFLRRQAFNDCGGLDSYLFMYHDDLDLCWRIRLLGYAISYFPKALCFHGVSKPKHKFPYILDRFVFYLEQRNRLYVAIKNYSYKNIVRFLPLITLLTLGRASFSALLSRNVSHLLVGIKAIVANIANLRKTLENRQHVQARRKVGESELMKHVFTHSLELAELQRAFSVRSIPEAKNDSYVPASIVPTEIECSS